MRPSAWHWLLVGGLGVAVAAAGCSSDEPSGDDDDDNGGNSGVGGTAPSAGKGGSGTAGSASGSGGTAGSGGSTPTAGTSGTAGSAPTTGGTSGAAGSSAGGAAGTTGTTGGAAGTAGGVGGMSGSAGDTSSGGTTAGSGGGGMAATLVEPIQRNGNYVLEFGDLYFEVNAAVGARIIDLHLKGATNAANLLTGSDINTNNYGSTFWPSPQTWTWPPEENIAEINNGAYTATVASPSVTMVGARNAATGLTVEKKFTANLAKASIDVEYKMTAGTAGSFAPWEITRVFKRGLSFYPTGASAPVAGGTFPVVPTTTSAGCTWHEAPTAAGVDQKMLADGGTGGWLAHVDGDVLIVKKFADIQPASAAPAEGEIEIFVSGAANYIELEQQGAYAPMAAGASVTWNVSWIVRKLPATVTATVGSQTLVDYVTSLVQ